MKYFVNENIHEIFLYSVSVYVSIKRKEKYTVNNRPAT